MTVKKSIPRYNVLRNKTTYGLDVEKENTQYSERVLRIRQVQAKLGMGETFILNAAKKGAFPRPIRLGARAVGWLESDIDKWLAERAEASKAENVGGNSDIEKTTGGR